METLFTDASCQILDTYRAMIQYPASIIFLTLIINDLLALVSRTSRYITFGKELITGGEGPKKMHRAFDVNIHLPYQHCAY